MNRFDVMNGEISCTLKWLPLWAEEVNKPGLEHGRPVSLSRSKHLRVCQAQITVTHIDRGFLSFPLIQSVTGADIDGEQERYRNPAGYECGQPCRK